MFSPKYFLRRARAAFSCPVLSAVLSKAPAAQYQPSQRKLARKKPVNRKQIMSCDGAAAAKKVFKTPDLVERLLPFLDTTSTVQLAQSEISCVVKLLKKNPALWKKIVERTFPGDFKLGLYEVDYYNRVRESFEEKRVKVVGLVSILKMMDKPNSHISQLLEVICEKSPQGFGVQSIQIGNCLSHGSSYSVSPLGFLLLEQIEAAFGLASEVTSIDLFKLDEPLVSALAQRVLRQEQKVTKMKTLNVVLETKESSEALLALVQSSVEVKLGTQGTNYTGQLRHTGMLYVCSGGVDGWAVLAKALSLAHFTGWVTAPEEMMREGRIEDLRTVWEALDGTWMWEGKEVFDKTLDGEMGWKALERRLGGK